MGDIRDELVRPGGRLVASNEKRLRAALLTVLDQVDYTAGACSVNEMVGAVLPVQVLRMARRVAEEAK